MLYWLLVLSWFYSLFFFSIFWLCPAVAGLVGFLFVMQLWQSPQTHCVRVFRERKQKQCFRLPCMNKKILRGPKSIINACCGSNWCGWVEIDRNEAFCSRGLGVCESTICEHGYNKRHLNLLKTYSIAEAGKRAVCHLQRLCAAAHPPSSYSSREMSPQW